MNLFSDFHHESLFYSLQLLFEKRLGWNLYRPIGMEWFEEGYWKINDLKDTAIQYLDINSIPNDGTQPLNDIFIPGQQKANPFLYHLEDKHQHTFQQALTLEGFREMPIDIIIASIPQHIEPFRKLAKEKNAKLIFQMGNMFDISSLRIDNLMASTIPFDTPGINSVFYHQEFPLDVFKPGGTPGKQITSFINVLPKNGGSVDYYTLKSLMPDFEFRSYGGQCDDGGIVGIENMATIMQRSMFGFHSKYGGDGYGHVLYNWYATGRPVITRGSDYKGKLGEELLKDGETCIDLDLHSYEEVVNIIQDMPSYMYDYMSQQSHQIFESKVNFDQEEVKLRKFLDNLK